MIKVHLEVQPSLAESLGMEAKGEEIIAVRESDSGRSVRDLLNQLSTKYQHFGRFVFDTSTQQLTGRAILFFNGHSLEPSQGLETTLNDGDTLAFVPFIEGG